MKVPAIGRLFPRGSGSAYVMLGALLVLFIVLLVAAFLFASQQQEHNRSHTRLASELRLLSQRIATQAIEAARGEKEDAFLRLNSLRTEFQAKLDDLRKGDEKTGMPPVPETVQVDLDIVADGWEKYARDADVILNAQAPIGQAVDAMAEVDKKMPTLIALSDEVAQLMVRNNASADKTYYTTYQAFLGQRMQSNLRRMGSGREDSIVASEIFLADAQRFEVVLRGLIEGDAKTEISRIYTPDAQSRLSEALAIFDEMRPGIDQIVQASNYLRKVVSSADSIEKSSEEILVRTSVLEQKLEGVGDKVSRYNYLGFVFGGLALASLLGLGLVFLWDTRRRLAATQAQNQRNQRAILRLLDEMTNLAEGDLTVHATVTEDITGAIADSVNYAIDALRSLVATIHETANEVSTAAENTRATAMALTDASNHQAREIASASAAINDMASLAENVSRTAQRAASVARESVDKSRAGSQTVRSTIEGMDAIRDRIQETAKRIKRLGESSQKIGEIVGLIKDIADQTNILALNAAIQASSAGEAGRGFAVVADEVQTLAEKSARATKEIENLVKTIQGDTSEAVNSMEQTTTNVVSGSNLAKDAGMSLADIEKVSNELSDLIQKISSAAGDQSNAATNVSATMNVIQEITMQTSDGTNETAESIGNLTELAAELRKSVSGFKLPGELGSDIDAGVEVASR